MLATGAALALLPLTGVQAQSEFNPWLQCEADELAPEIVPLTPNAPPPDQLPIQAEANQVESTSTLSVLEGDVKLSQGDQHLRANQVTLDRPTNHLRVEGGFTYGDPERALRGQRAEVDLDADTGQFGDVDYYLPRRNAQGHAKTVHVDQPQQYTRLKDATYSTCPRGREVWELRARQFNLNTATGRGSAHNIVLAFKDVPVFYFPYLSFPITDERQSGFLFPRQGYDSKTGLDLALPYYWNIAPNHDMTFTPRFLSTRGLLLGAEYRYLYPKHQGKIDAEYMPNDRRLDDDRSSFNIVDHATPLPNLYTNLRFEYVSDDDYIRDLNNNLDFLTANYLERYLDVQYQSDWWRVLARVQGYQILTPEIFTLTGDPYERLPQILFDGAWPTGAGGFNYRLHSEIVRFDQSHADVVNGTRLDLWPSVGWALEKPWGYLKPQGGFRYTTYQLNDTDPGANDAPSRAVPILSLDSGLIFDRPLQIDWLGVASGTQTLEPRLYYLYVPYRDQDDIPLFDSGVMDRDFDWLFRQNRFVGTDRLGDANQLTAALTTRLIDGPSGRERLRASIGQIQYFADRRVTLTPDQLPDTEANSGMIAQGTLNLSGNWSVQSGLQLKPDNSDLLRTALNLRYYASPRRFVNLSYLRDRNPLDLGISDQIHSVDMSFVWPLTSRLRMMARWNRALNIDRNLEILAGLEYEDCCWALRAVTRQYRDSPLEVDTQSGFYLELELKGLSRLGGGLEGVLQTSILGYQPIRY
ncbi:MAG: LPS assembly protein LptD [Phycisphaerales bacterium]|nr:LPS assembly protein LptD [Phycisphaerales bacterium]